MSNTVYQIQRRREDVKAKKLRREGIVPAVIYGKGHKDSMPVEINMQEAAKLLKENTQTSIIRLEGLDEAVNVIVKEVQRANTSFMVEHIDFQSISLREILTVNVPIHFIGEETLQYNQLLFQPNVQELPLKGPAEDLPERLELDVSELQFEDKVFAESISIPEGIELAGEKDELIGVVISAAAIEEEPEAVTEGEVADEVPLVDEKEKE